MALNNLTLYDDRLGFIPVGSPNLIIGEVRTVTATHIINATDMPGPLKNNAQAFAKDPSYNPVSSLKASKTLSLGFSGSLKVDKYPDVAEQTIGFPISYDINITNPLTNGFTVKNITAQDVIYHPTAHTVVVNLDKTTLLPGETANGTVVVYNIVQEDIRGPPAGKIGAGLPVITDYASALGYPSWETPPSGATVSGVNTKTVGILYETNQESVKTASPEEGAPHSQTTFHITVSNPGNVLLNRTELWDQLPAGLSFISANPAQSSVSTSGGITTIYWANLSQSFNAVLNPGDHFDVDVVASFNGDKYGELTNFVTNTGYNLRNESITNTTEKDITARKQNIVVVKTPDIASGSPSTVVNFTLDVQNTGNISLKNVFVSDLLPTGMTYVASSPNSTHSGQNVYWSDIGPIAVGNSRQLWIKAHIDGPIFGNQTLTNYVEVEGKPELGDNVTNSTTADVKAQDANIEIKKTADPNFGSPSTNVNFTLLVKNNGNASLPHVFVSDLLPTGMSYVSSSSGSTHSGQTVSWSDIGPMSSGASKQLWIVAHIDGPVSGIQTLTNRVDVEGKPEHGNNVTNNTTTTVEVREPKISVSKTANLTFGSPSTNVNFTLVVDNTGSTLLPHVFVSDLLPTGMSYVSSSSGSTNSGQTVSWSDIGPMSSGDSKQLWIVAHIDGPISGIQTLTNRVDVEGKPEHGNNVTNNTTTTVEAREPKITVTKTADPTFGSPSTNVNFTLVVKNTGSTLLPHVFVSDLLPTGMSYVSSSAGSTNSGQTVSWSDIGPMSSGASKQLWIVAHIDGPVSGIQTLTNRVDVVGKPEHGNNVTNNTTTTVEAREPKITVTKTADPTFGSPSTNVNFTLVVKNTGSTLLPHVFVSDLLPTGMSYVSSSSGSMHSGQTVSWSDIGPMSSGDSKQLWIVAHIDGPVSGIQTLTNRVDVEGKPEHGNNVTNNTTTTVEAREPKITVTKTADPTFGSPSTNVTFTLIVTNTGSTPLPNVFVSDLLPTGMSYVSSSPGSTHSGQTVSWSDIGPLAASGSKSLEIVAHIDGPISGIQTLTNRVDVAGKPEHGQNVTNSSTADVRAQEANIQVTKTADPTFGSPSTNVTFTLVVKNSGSTQLPHVFVTDLLPTGMSYVSSSIGSTHSGQTVGWSDIGPLAASGSKSLEIVAHIDGPISGIQTLTNRVDVEGKPEHGQNVTNSSTADVRAQEANIQVTKTADPTFGSPSTNVTFTLLVKNSGSTSLPHVFVSDLLPTGMSYVSSSIGSTHSGQTVGWSDIGPMSAGATKTLEIVAHIDGPISGIQTLTNRVDVEGKPEHGQNVTNSSTADVRAQEANIQVTKTADPTFGSPSTNVTFTLLVKNSGSTSLPHVFVTDLLPTGMSYVSSSIGSTHIGQTVSWSDIGPLAASGSKSLEIVAHIDGPISGIQTLTNCVDVAGKPEHGQNVTNSSTADVRAQEANIQVTKTADPTFGSPSTNVTFTLVVKNSGSTSLPHVFVTDLLPTGMSYVSSSIGSTHSGQTVSWSDIGPLAASGSKSLEIVAHIDGPISGIQTLTNRVDVAGKPEHGQNVTNSSTADVRAQEANIQVTKTADPTFGSPSTNVTFTLLVKNSGSTSLPHVFVSDLLPTGMSYVSSSIGSTHSGQTVGWSDIGPMSAGASKSLEIVAHIDGPISGIQTLTNRVNVEGKPEHGQNVTNSSTADVRAQEANIQVTKTADPTFGSPSTNVTFTLVVKNSGSTSLPHVFVSDLLPTGMSYVSSSAGSTHSGQTVAWSDIGPMSAGASKSLEIVAHIDGPIRGIQTLTNRVNVEGKPEHGLNVTNSSTADVRAQEANIQVTKTADPTFGSPSTNVTFTLVVKNSGSTALPHVFVSDLLPTGMSYVSSSAGSTHSGQTVGWSDIGPMSAGASKSLEIVAHIDGPISGIQTLTNRVDVEGKPEHGQNVTNSSTADVRAQEANIQVTKTADPTFGSPSTNVTFTLQVKNSGSTPLPHVFVSDLLPTGMSYVSSSIGSTHSGQTVGWSDIGPMSAGASKSLEIVAHIDGPISGIKTLTNRVDVEGKPEHGQNVTNSSTADVRAQEANIQVTKTADPTFGSPSTNVTFTLQVKNSGSTPLPHVFVTDLLPTGMSYVSSSIGSTHSGQTVSWSDIGPMSAGASKSLEIVAHIDGPISGIQTLTNRVDVEGKPEHGQNVTNSSTADVRAQEANIQVTKTADPTFGSPSTNVTFTLLVKNSGSTPLPHVFVTDLLPTGMSYVSSSIGSTHSGQIVSWSDIGPMSAGATKTLEIVAHIDGPISGIQTLTNRVDVEGKPEHGQNVTNSSTADVRAQEANIQVTKTADPTFGSPSTNVTFTLLVKNSGSTPLPHVFVTDLLPTGMSYVSSSIGSTHSGQIVSWSDIGPMSAGATKTLEIVAHIDGPISGIQTLTNRVDVEGKPEHGQNVTNSSTADVRAQEANIQVTKTADPTFGSPSTNVTFTLVVKNSGSTPLPHVFVTDLLPTGMSYVSSSIGSTHSGQIVSWSDIGPMSAGATKTLEIVAHIDGPISGIQTLTNRVDVEGKPEHGQNVTNSSTADVRAQEANIQVTKTADPTFGSPSTNVTFTLLVKNSGSTPLPHVFVTDLLPTSMSYVSSSIGSTHGGQIVGWSDIGPLAASGSKSLEIVAHIDGPISGIQTLTNRVDVEGKPEHGQNVTNSSTADVRAQEANIQVTKTADPTFGSPSTNVTFTLLVKNSGSTPLPHVFVTDLLPTGMSYVSSSIGSTHGGQTVGWSDIGPMSAGASKSLEIVAHIDGPISGIQTLTNRVDVEGKPEHGQNVTNSSTADVRAQEANIQVTKTADPTFGSPSTNVTFTLVVKNSGSTSLPHVFVTDLLPTGMSYVSSSIGSTHSGQTVSWSDIGPLAASGSKSLEIVAHIDGPISGIQTLTNRVDVAGKPEHGQNVTNSSTADVRAQEANIQVTKTADPTFGSPSTNVTFTLVVKNSGSTSLPHVFVTDLLPTGMSYVSSSIGSTHSGQTVSWSDIGPLAASGSKSLEIVAHIDGPISGIQTLTNRVDVAGKPEHGQNVTNSSTADVRAQEANIQVTKTADPTFGSPSTNVTFTLLVKNSGSTSLPHVFVSDLLPTGMSYVSSSIGSTHSGQTVGWSDIGPLAAGASKSLEIVAHIDGPISGIQTLTNRVDVEGKPEHGQNVTNSSTADVRAQEANIQVTKTADPTFGSPSTNVTFTLLVKNSGSTPLPHVFVTDLLPTGMSYVSSSIGSTHIGQTVGWSDIGPMSAGASKSLEIVAHIDGPISGIQTLTNRVDVDGKPEHGQNVTNSSTADVRAQEAQISVTKTADPTFGSKSTLVTFTMNVNNTASAPLPHVFVHDLLPAGLTYHSSSTGSTHSGQNVDWSDIGPMSAGSMKSLWIKATIDGTVYGMLTNQVDVEGKPEYGDNVTDSATATVEAGKADILVTKIANPAFGSAGTLVNFTLDVTNSGDSLLSHIFVNDLLPDGLTYDSSSSGGVNAGQTVYWSDIGPMEAGSSKSLWIKALIDGSKYGLLTNIVDVEGQPQYGENVTSRATADVTALESGILVEKTAVPDHGAAGTIVRFSLAVTNTAHIDLKNVFVTDKLPEGMSYVASDGGINNGLFINWSDIGPLPSRAPAKMLWIDARIDGPITQTEILTNRVDVDGRPEYGSNVTGFDTADVEAQAAGIIADKTADPTMGSKGVIITFPMRITNQETMKMVKVKGVDTLPLGLDYVSATPEPSSIKSLPDGSLEIEWEDLGPLNTGESHDLIIMARVNGSVMGTLTNEINATGVPEYGADVYASDTADVLVQSAAISVTKNASPEEGIPGEKITFTIVIQNTGSATLCQVNGEDIIPDGLQYLSDDHNGTLATPNKVVWNDLGCLESGETIKITLETEIVGTILGNLTNEVRAKGWPYCARSRQKDLAILQSDPNLKPCGDPVEASAKATVRAKPEPYVITKTSDKPSYRPGEEMTYTITVCNVMLYQDLEEVVVKDVFLDKKVQIIASYPESDNGEWYFSSIPRASNPDHCKTITLVAVYPASNMTFDLGESAVSGSGFVNVHNDLSTGTSPFPVTNCVYVTAKIYDTDRTDYTSWSREKCYSVTIADAGTELLTREHGSGDYQTEEKTKLIMKNRSIESRKSVSASYFPTAFQLPNSKGINYTSKWTEESRAKNYITGASMHETYRYATNIDRDSYFKLDENGSEMKVDSNFTGKGSIGFLKKSSPSAGPKQKPVFEDREDYSGSFRLNESISEYGTNAYAEKYATGVGFVAADKRLGNSQRTYESGTGSYKSEEKIDTFSNYMAKDIELAHRPSNYSYSSNFGGKQDLKWSEGMSSKSGILRGGDIISANHSSCGPVKKVETVCSNSSAAAPATLISEKYSSLEYLKKDSIALGLNEMKTNATFKGVADFRAKIASSNATNEVDSEEQYVGDYDVSRHILLTGVSKYNRPHIYVTKDGQMKSEWVNLVNSTVADYVITVTNDGNRALAPIYVTDIFPPGTQYVSSSFKPSSLTATGANWTILHLGIGNSLTILLKLNITEEAPGNVVNCVVASGIAGDALISSTNCSVLESDWLSCCPPKVSLEKKAQLDLSDPAVVHYTIMLRNNASSIMAAKVTDEIPGDMSFLQSSIEPYSIDSNYIHWNFLNLQPGELVTIEYSMHAARNGAYTNRAHLDATALDGSGSNSADASAYIDVRGTGVAPKTARYDGWQPPDWEFNTSEEGISI